MSVNSDSVVVFETEIPVDGTALLAQLAAANISTDIAGAAETAIKQISVPAFAADAASTIVMAYLDAQGVDAGEITYLEKGGEPVVIFEAISHAESTYITSILEGAGLQAVAQSSGYSSAYGLSLLPVDPIIILVPAHQADAAAAVIESYSEDSDSVDAADGTIE